MKKKYAVVYELVSHRKAFVEAESKEEAERLFHAGEVIDDFHDQDYAIDVRGVRELDEFPAFRGKEYDPRRHG